MVTIQPNFYQQYKLYCLLLGLHSTNEFRNKAYLNAEPLLKKNQHEKEWIIIRDLLIKNQIKESVIDKINQFFTHSTCPELDQFLAETPIGLIQLLTIRGLGAKRVRELWQKYAITTPQQLLEACLTGQLQQWKGFGPTTALNYIDTLNFYLQNKNHFHWVKANNLWQQIKTYFQQNLPNYFCQAVGDFARKLETVIQLNLISNLPQIEWRKHFNNQFDIVTLNEKMFKIVHENSVPILVSLVDPTNLNQIFQLTCTEDFYQEYLIHYPNPQNDCQIPIPQRDQPFYIKYYKNHKILPPLSRKDIKGLIHCHSTWSDGTNSLLEMASGAKELGFEYIIITDHSQSAVYARGLTPTRVKAQHQEIDELNSVLAPFKIFKGIESDILSSGDLDYPPEILNLFDLIVASVHNQLEQNSAEATKRVLKAIKNPYTSILGHSCGRLLLSRPGLELDYEQIVKACQEFNVVIELNCNYKRLDIDWRYLNRVLELNVLTSLNPDAHSLAMIDELEFGLNIVEKTLVQPRNNLSSFSLAEIENFIALQKRKRNFKQEHIN